MGRVFIRAAMCTLVAGLLTTSSASAARVTGTCSAGSASKSDAFTLTAALRDVRAMAFTELAAQPVRWRGFDRIRTATASPKRLVKKPSALAEPVGIHYSWFEDPECPESPDSCQIHIEYDDSSMVFAWTGSYWCYYPTWKNYVWYNEAAYNACAAIPACINNDTRSGGC